MTDETPSNPYQSPTTTAEPETTAGTVTLAGRGQRFLGALIDGLVQLAIVGPLVFFTGAWDAMMNSGGQLSLSTTLTWFIVGEVAFLAIQGWLLFNRQQTVGKWLLSMKIVGMDDAHVPAGKLYGLRYLLFHVLAQIPIINMLMIIDPLLIFRRDKRCLHDLLAGTQVIESRP